MKPALAITMGDPAGVGPDIVSTLLRQPPVAAVDLLIVGDHTLLDVPPSIPHFGVDEISAWLADGPERAPLAVCSATTFGVRPQPVAMPQAVPAAMQVDAAPLMTDAHRRAPLTYLEVAVDLCRRGSLQGIVTAPLNKHEVTKVSSGFIGHTEYLAQRCGNVPVAMLMHAPNLKVALFTTHIGLREVPERIQQQPLVDMLCLIDRSMRRQLAMPALRIGVAGLNPHCGEGLFGAGEEAIIAAAIKQAGDLGILASGPWPADSLFWRAVEGEFDVVLALYHDQGLGPIKTIAFNKAVNVTLGLPFVRTSVDHGVAYSLAGTGRADPQSLFAAVDLAATMAVIHQARQGQGEGSGA